MHCTPQLSISYIACTRPACMRACTCSVQMDSCDSANLLAFPGDENGWKGKGPMLACP